MEKRKRPSYSSGAESRPSHHGAPTRKSGRRRWVLAAEVWSGRPRVCRLPGRLLGHAAAAQVARVVRALNVRGRGEYRLSRRWRGNSAEVHQ